MSPNTQAKILRVLQEHEFERLGDPDDRVDVRLIAHQPQPPTMAARALSRGPLLPLNVVSIDMPRSGTEGGRAALAEFFVRRFSGELKKKIDGFSRTRSSC